MGLRSIRTFRWDMLLIFDKKRNVEEVRSANVEVTESLSLTLVL